MAHPDSRVLQAQLQSLFSDELVIERELGRGGMAVVFLGFDPALQRHVAIKMLLPEVAVDVTVIERFLREGRTVASLDHPHVVRVLSVRSRQGTCAIVMQFVEGRSLDVVLKEQGSLSFEVATRILAQVAAALQHAHDRGVIHRDVKPANVLIDRAGRAVVTDFGIARRDDGFTPTKTGFILGTADYMSPEQRAGERVTPATDQYAFGVMAFELLTGRLPFVGDLATTTRGHMTQPPPRLQSVRPELPDAIEALVQRTLAKAPEERWPSLAEVVAHFNMMAPNVGATPEPAETFDTRRVNTPVVIRAVRTPAEAAPAPPPLSIAAPPAAAPPAGRGGIRMIIAALLVATALAAAIYLLR